jgi:hypothetical protein
MLHSLLTGLPVIVLCLVLQAVFVTFCLRYYVRFRQEHASAHSYWRDIQLLSVVMLLALLGNMAQIVIWAILFRVLGEFSDMSTAIYHSAVNFVTLGYGDIVMSQPRRLLGPIEGANGILMFGVSTAVMTAAVMDVIKYNMARDGPDGSVP